MKKKYVQAMMAGMTAMLSLTLPVTSVWAAVPEKEQTVYVNADENGKVEKVIVSNWLKNAGNDKTLEDKSELKNIANVKGEETFKENGSGNLVWNADGKDIYYQGETDKELPVSVKMTYFLDGKEILPSDLAGKSGKVKIRIDYENHAETETEIDGKKEKICTPFLMVTGMILPTEKYSNIEVKNGKVISDGKNEIVVGMGFPGLSDSLKLSDMKGFEDKKIPDHVEITADVKDFSLALTATVATTGTLNELGFDEIENMDELEEKLNLLSDSSEALVEGSKTLKDGIEELNTAADAFVEGLDSADEGAGQLQNGIDTMNGKKGELLDGINQLTGGMGDLKNGADDLENGVTSYTDGAAQIADGIAQADDGAAQLKAGLDTLNSKKEALTGGIEQLSKGSKALEGGSAEFAENLKAYTDGVKNLDLGIAQLNQTLKPYVEKFGTLPEIVKGLGSAIGGMSSGAEMFRQGALAVKEGAAGMQTQLAVLNTAIGGAVQYMGVAEAAIENMQSPDVNGISTAVSAQAQSAVNDSMASVQKNVNEQANAQLNQYKANVRAALDSVEGLTEEQKAAVLGQIGSISVSVGTPNVQVEVTPEYMPDNSVMIGQLAAAKQGLSQIQGKLAETQIDTSDLAKLENGANEAAAGAGMMQEKLNELQKELGGMGNVQTALEQLAKGVEKLAEGSKTLSDNNDALNGGAKQLAGGAAQVNEGIGALADGASALSDGVSQLAAGADTLYAGTKQLRSGSSSLIANNFALVSGVKKLNAGSSELLDGGLKLKSGAAALSDGIGQLADGSLALKDGTGKLAAAGKELKEGTTKLSDGSSELADGMEKFDEEGIQELTSLLKGEAKNVLDRLRAVADADKTYTAFDGAQDAGGNVKFIIETAGIE